MKPLPIRKAGEFFDAGSAEINEWRVYARDIYYKMDGFSNITLPEKEELARKLFGSLGDGCMFESGLRTEVGKNIHIGDRFYCNFNTVFIDLFEIRIGNGVMFGPNVSIITVNHPLNAEERRTPVVTGGPIVIEDDVWIGTGAIVLPNVRIGKGAVIAAGAVVTRDVEPYTVVAGVPARFMKRTDVPDI